jgi:hypothetical protein
LHLQHRETVPLPRTVSPGAQQARLPAAGRSRDDRHLPRHRAIQGSEKTAPVDQPGSCVSHRQRPALISTPDTLASVTQDAKGKGKLAAKIWRISLSTLLAMLAEAALGAAVSD